MSPEKSHLLIRAAEWLDSAASNLEKYGEAVRLGPWDEEKSPEIVARVDGLFREIHDVIAEIKTLGPQYPENVAPLMLNERLACYEFTVDDPSSGRPRVMVSSRAVPTRGVTPKPGPEAFRTGESQVRRVWLLKPLAPVKVHELRVETCHVVTDTGLVYVYPRYANMIVTEEEISAVMNIVKPRETEE